MDLEVSDVMPPEVWTAWGLKPHDNALKLPGGGEQSIRVGPIVYKPVEDIEEAEWCQECLSRLVPNQFRIAVPIRSPKGHWVDAGWIASRWIEGVAGPEGHWVQVLEVSAQFHRALSKVARPPFLLQRTHRWALADRAAWGEASMQWVPSTLPRALMLKNLLRPVNLPVQVIHGDLSGNVLFAAGLTPAVIDFSPYWRPAAFADAVILMDGMLWFAWDDILPLIPRTMTFLQLLLRACLCRLGALNERARTVDPACVTELPTFDRTIAWLEANLR